MDVKLLSSFHVVDCNVLIEKEGDAGALQPYIVEMSSNKEGFIPTMDAKAMRAFSRTNKRKQGSQASGPVLVTETSMRSLPPLYLISLSARRLARVEVKVPPPFLLHRTQRFPNPFPRVKLSCLEKEKMGGELVDLRNEKVKSDDLLAEKTKLLAAAEEKILAEQKGRKEETDNLKAEISFQYKQGFEKAVDQIKFLHPEIVIDEVGAFKEIRDGKLVDIPDDEE
ncbi:hypothetical protein SESBI_45042 [Sesbania bispinosa]|nr:hypothetical protein SESBI_45042 [Sesbania bispinosa]